MPKVKLNNTFLAKVTPPTDKLKVDYFDTEVIGLMLEVRKSGNMTFYYRYNKESKTILHKLSGTEYMNLDEARRLATKMRKAIATDSLETMFIKKDKSTLTMQTFYDDYYLPYIIKHIKSHTTNISVFKNHILPLFSLTQLNQIKKMEIMKAHTDMVHKKKLSPATANKFLIFISHAFHIAIDLQLQDIKENPAKGIKYFQVNNERQRFLTRVETKRLMKAVLESDNTHLQYIIPMLVLSGCRKSELLKAKWCDFNLIQMSWTLPLTKNGKNRILPLTPQLLEVYNQIPKDSNTYLFPSPYTNKPYITIYRSWNTARTQAGLKDVRMHDLRHTFASALVNGGRSLYEVQMLLGHSTSKMTQRYAHLNNESLLAAASCAGKLLK